MFLAVSLLLLCAANFVSAEFQCKRIAGSLRQIDAGAGKVIGVNKDGDIFQWVNSKWMNIPGKMKHVSAGRAGVLGVNRANEVYELHGHTWVRIPGHLKRVDAGGNMFLAGVDVQGNVFCLRKSCTFSRSPVPFTQIEKKLTHYSCGLFNCWGVNEAHNIFIRHSVSQTACQGSGWKQVEGRLVMIEVGEDGSVFGINLKGHVFRRVGISNKNRGGTSWAQVNIQGTFRYVSYDKGVLWLINTADEIYHCHGHRGCNN